MSNKISICVILLVMVLGSTITLYAQTRTKVCGSKFDIAKIKSNNASRYQQVLNINTQLAKYKQSLQTQGLVANPNATIIIPVVVHVLHFGEAIGTGRNISDDQVRSQIEVLNEDFRRLNADRTNTPAAFQGVASDPRFEFRLACVDPNGVATTGITRTRAAIAQFPNPSSTLLADNAINEQGMRIKFTSQGGRDAWATNNYLNIWVCDMAGGVLGYATFPDQFAQNPNVDGVVVLFNSFGRRGNLQASFNLGRTATHEVGHYLNLRHVWGDANCGDDEVADTPTQTAPNAGCPVFPRRTCGNTTNGDMFMNYMDYTNDNCMNTFTNGQRDRERALFFAGGVRSRFFYRIDGTTTSLCQNATARFTTPNPLCIPITWTVRGPITIQSGQNTNNLIVQPNGIGTATITLTAGPYTDTRQIQVTNTTANTLISGTYSSAGSTKTLNSYNTAVLGSTSVNISASNATGFTWTRSSGNVTWTGGGSGTYTGNSIDFSLTSTNSSISFNVEATTPCGIINQSFSFNANSWSFRAAPNPATSTLRISGTQITQPTARVAETPLKFELRLYDKYDKS